jgi:tRNA uridine 5-carbamoylmethylation protein Kti12
MIQVVIAGQPASGKTTLAYVIQQALLARGFTDINVVDNVSGLEDENESFSLRDAKFKEACVNAVSTRKVEIKTVQLKLERKCCGGCKTV